MSGILRVLCNRFHSLIFPMSEDSKLATWHTYQAAWAPQLSTAERQELLTSSVAEDGVYTDPNSECVGQATLLAHIEAFRQQLPDAPFRNRTFRSHHAQSLAEWTLYDAHGAELQPGASYARFGADGRLTHIAGFF